jgi:hypothetical protein
MKTFIRATIICGVLFLVGMGTLMAQEVAYAPGPVIAIPNPGSNSGFTWGDVNGDNILDVLFRSNNLMINSGTAFSQLTTAGIPAGVDACGMAFADFNGDGKPDVFEVVQTSNATALLINNDGVSFKPMTGTGDLATAGSNCISWGGISVADIDHSGYLSLAWAGTATGSPIGGNNTPSSPGGGIWLLKGGPNGFTNLGRGSTPANRAIDTTLTYEAWNVSFFDANNDGYADLLMPSYRNGFSKFDVGLTSGSRKGTVLFVNDGTGKFIVPTAATLGRPIYELDSVSASGTIYAGTKDDMGIIVDDTVRHFEALAHIVGDFNNDGIVDLFMASNGANNYDGYYGLRNNVIIYGKGDGTFTYKYNVTQPIVANNGIPVNTYIRSWAGGDYNNDGKLDILTVDGTNTLLRNNGDGTFTNVTATDGLTGAALGFRGGAFVDYNNDGWLDIFSYTGTTCTLLKNNPGTNTNKWIGFRPVGKNHNISAIGARFTVYAGGVKQIRTISSDAGSKGMGGDLWANFGLGTATAVDSVSVMWPDGVKQTWAGSVFTVNSYKTLYEGSVVTAAPATSRPSWAAGDTNLTSNNTLKWTKVTGGTVPIQYTVQIGINKAMSTILQTLPSITDTFKVVKVPLASKLYWNVKATSGSFASTYSAVDSFRTNMTPATTVPKKLSPTTSQLHLPKQPTLVCSSTPEAYIYHFQLDTLNRFAGRDTLTGAARFTGLLFNDSTTVIDTTKLMSALTPGRMYYWRVRGWNAAGVSAFSPVDSFTIQYLPLATTLVYPAHNQADAPADTLVFKVQKVDADSMYVFQTWTYTSAGQQFRSDTVKQNPALTLTGLTNRARYYWKVQVGNQAGWSAFTAVDSFTTVIELAKSPICVSPRNSSAEPRKAKFVWNRAVNAVWYHLQVATTNFNSPSDVVEDATVQDTSYVIKDTLIAATIYYWHVSSINLGGESVFSSASHFTSGYGITGVTQQLAEIPQEYTLLQNYPNPFNPSTTIQYDLPSSSYVKLFVYDVLGRVVATLVDGVQPASRYNVQWNASCLSSGVYFYRIDARSQDGSKTFTLVKKLVLMK